MSTSKAFRAIGHPHSSEHTKLNVTDVGNYRTTLDYLQTGQLPPKTTGGEMYSDRNRFSVLRAFQAGVSCPSGSAFGGANPTISLICPACNPNNIIPVTTLIGGDNYTESTNILSGGNSTTNASLIYLGGIA